MNLACKQIQTLRAQTTKQTSKLLKVKSRDKDNAHKRFILIHIYLRLCLVS